MRRGWAGARKPGLSGSHNVTLPFVLSKCRRLSSLPAFPLSLRGRERIQQREIGSAGQIRCHAFFSLFFSLSRFPSCLSTPFFTCPFCESLFPSPFVVSVNQCLSRVLVTDKGVQLPLFPACCDIVAVFVPQLALSREGDHCGLQAVSLGGQLRALVGRLLRSSRSMIGLRAF